MAPPDGVSLAPTRARDGPRDHDSNGRKRTATIVSGRCECPLPALTVRKFVARSPAIIQPVFCDMKVLNAFGPFRLTLALSWLRGSPYLEPDRKRCSKRMTSRRAAASPDCSPAFPSRFRAVKHW